MGVLHIVMYEFKPLATPEEITSVCNSMLSLKEKCLHPDTNRAYIKSVVGGADTSEEGLQDGTTHVFVYEFETAEDRKVYLERDVVRREVVGRNEGVVERVRVVDFEPGVWGSRVR
ncbi:putative stress responsive a b barrel domain protein [Echria macrotheca]|uniref:Stress responsive a b barrel domain protein n=1 Tax=Echria macrotheca TaxID=438768 RepID=A0AAJ0BBV1_9PEZI|nr:putative stress responsive a b barrel domain protein [Echria macrotheca]